MEFVEGKIVEEKEFGGVVFPKTLHPPNGVYEANELVEMVKGKREWLCELLQRHSAILFRGFGLFSAQDFGRVVEAFKWDEMGYLGPAARFKVADRVQTANEVPLDQLINFHHEMAQAKQFPSKIFFFCSQPSPEGGETSIVPSHIVVEKMEERVPEFMAKLSQTGYILGLKTRKDNDSSEIFSQAWKLIIKTEDKAEFEERVKEKMDCSSVKFNEHGSVEFVHGPMNPIRELGGRRVWFNTILGYTSDERDINLRFGDETSFPLEALDAHKKILDETCVDLKWEKGDVLLLDNLCVQHARRPGKPPRVILVSICK
ncbi:hypothetical protein HHK36_009133 [Tetracentron sinense]|uniref:TauD/TfdA-like domain-containing protein n=1 Tax=Tetracentron sinense TaxID=13715 RepID=A0A835DI38_TETSI|nr:hypothetical protein HHK36_009133 [Tetracentron sinense]